MDKNAILQRTEIGRKTIRTKEVKLTQSERLVLIIVDGISTIREVRDRVWSISDERFTRALKRLFEKDLIFEVLMPVPGQEREVLDQEVMDRFLQQDPVDPVTNISFDPEDEFGSDMAEALGFKQNLARTSESEQGAADISMSKGATDAGTKKSGALSGLHLPASNSFGEAATSKLQRLVNVASSENGSKRSPALSNAKVSPGETTVGSPAFKRLVSKAANSDEESRLSETKASTASRAGAATQAQAALVGDLPKRANAVCFFSERKEYPGLEKVLHLADNLPDNWPENLFEEDSCITVQTAKWPNRLSRGGKVVLWIGIYAGVLEITYTITRTFLQ